MKKIFIYGCMLLISLTAFSQTANPTDPSLSPDGLLDNVFDQYGTSYKLSDILTGNGVRDPNGAVLKATNPTPLHCGYFDLYLEEGCGLNTTDPDYINRRNVVCQVFTDISNFINSPLTNAGNNTKVNIWVRDINSVIVAPDSPAGVLGLASSFYNMPYNTAAGFGGIVDNEIWKTIHTGVDSYTNVVSPLVASGISSGTSGVFYHGMMAFNFSDSSIVWNTSLTATSFPNQYDLYSVILHELTHALGFASLISATGASKFNAGYNYYSRYDRFLKNAGNTQFLLTNTGACNSMYNYSFNSALSNSILHPTATPYCSNTIRFVGTSNVPVYTPATFAPPSSLSHFEDLCVSPNIDNAYFVMSDAIGKNVIKRYLKPQERNTLRDLGYSVKTTYGVSTTYQGTTTYTGTITGITVAGINDGINPDGTYKYIGDATVANPIVINSSTNSSIRILSNDTSATGFECLQDVFSAATFSATSGTTITNVTFSTSVTGVHLLRYVPVNGTQRGNITYIYVYVNDVNNCGVPTTCNLVINGDFEQHGALTPHTDNMSDACNWSKAVSSSPDYFNVDALHLSTYSPTVPCNFSGYEPDLTANKKGYAGMGIRKNANAIYTTGENIKTKLSSALLPNTSYQLSFDVSLGEGASANKTKFQAYLSPNFISYPSSGEIPISNPAMLFTDPNYADVTSGWRKVIFNFTTDATAGQNTLYLGGLSQFSVVANTPSVQGLYSCNYVNANSNNPNDGNLSGYCYYFLDNVSLIPLNGGSFTLPANLCHDTQSLPDLNAYLSGLPTNGVFAGPGVNFNGSTYTLNEMFDMDGGLATISYTYTNASGCSVTIYSNINIELPIIPSISGSSTAYTTAPNNTTINTTTIPSGYTALWTITGGTGTITTANNLSSVGVTWTSLPGNLTLTLTSPGGCTFTATKSIINQFNCDCLNTFYFTATQTAAKTATFTVLNSNPNCTLTARCRWNYGDNANIYLALSGSSHTYASSGTYNVTLYTSIVGDYDETICLGNPYSANVTVTSGGKTGRQMNPTGDLIIYPSPATSILNFNFSLNHSEVVETVIRTVEGKELVRKEWDLNKGKHEIQLELPNNISDGMIFVEFSSSEKKEIRTVIVKKN